MLRQCPGRYAIHAGRNLPDKELRYLRTVIVTAAIHRGFNYELRGKPLTPPLNLPALGKRQTIYIDFWSSHRPVFLINSRQGQFSAAQGTAPWASHFTSPSSPYPEVTDSFCRVP
jgi:hypothetical protein